ncbi:MAG TPA: hypothetical protein VF438_03805 [Candidatus Paceibacterota bacterium]
MHQRHLIQDFLIVAASVIVAILLAETTFLDTVILGSTVAAPLKAFVAGLFFTSAFTTAPAIVILGKLAQTNSAILVGLVGALGAVCGDFLLFSFVRSRLAADMKYLLSTRAATKFRYIVHMRLFRWISPFVALLIIASPLPDELGITLLGLTKTKTSVFVPFTFVANFVGILIVGIVAQAL